MTKRKVYFAVCFVWFYSFCLAFAHFFLKGKRTFTLILMAFSFFVPLLVIVTAYSIAVKVALHHLRNIQATSPAQRRKSHGCFLKEIKAAKTLALVVGAFVICWLPFLVMTMIYTLCKPHCPEFNLEVTWVTKWVQYGNSLINNITL